MCEFIKLPDGVVRKDLIKDVLKKEGHYYEGGSWFDVVVQTDERCYRYREERS